MLRSLVGSEMCIRDRATTTTFCSDKLIEFAAEDQGLGVSYDWNFGNNATPQFGTGLSASTTFNSTGNQSIILTVSSGDCIAETSLLLDVQEGNFWMDAGGDATICLGESALLGGAPTGPVGATYNWFPVDNLNTVTASNPIATPDSTTIYTCLLYTSPSPRDS